MHIINKKSPLYPPLNKGGKGGFHMEAIIKAANVLSLFP